MSIREPQRGNREPQTGTREPQRGTRETQRGTRELQMRTNEPQWGTKEPHNGNREPQKGTREPQRDTRKSNQSGGHIIPATENQSPNRPRGRIRQAQLHYARSGPATTNVRATATKLATSS